ncbi:universal stress protein [Streptomyces sp. TRM66268-LWL]|uniref:Universal stress protein n=1 Tax=Streptomyces polyasparticus TaxID=2767826 RepID=A0ABR7SPQ8_9ACTN|nr:universal stress protein [Streptomyces polyasparticus]MBC9717393.1 universal stress protein [Streptomyces polyasparticus]
MVRPITVGVNGSRESLAAVDWAAEEALRCGLPLRIVHAWEVPPAKGDQEALPELQVPRYWARRILRGCADRAAERFPQVVLDAEQISRPPVPALLAESGSAELLVLGHQGLGGMAAAFAGSVGEAVVAQARRPVVLVRADGDTARDVPPGAGNTVAPRGVLVAVDPSRAGDDLLAVAFEAARRRGASLMVLYAWRPAEGHGAARRKAGRREAVQALGALIDPWRDKYPTVELRAQVVQDRPAHALGAAARDASLVIVGRRIRHSSLGSHTGRVTHWAMHHVHCPVVVVAHS